MTLLCGEIYETTLSMKNNGVLGAKNIYIVCSRTSFFSLGTTSNINFSMLNSYKKNNILKVPIDQLSPGEQVIFPIYLYGIEGAGVHEIDFVFYYEPVECVKLVPYRILHHTLHIQTLSTLSLSAHWQPSLVNNCPYDGSSKEITASGPKEGYVLVLSNHKYLFQMTSFSNTITHWSIYKNII